MKTQVKTILDSVVSGLGKAESFRKIYPLLDSGAELAEAANYALAKAKAAKEYKAERIKALRGLVRVSMLRAREDVDTNHWLKSVSLEFKGDGFELVPFKAKAKADTKGKGKGKAEGDTVSPEAVKAQIEAAVKSRKAEITAAQKAAVDLAKVKTAEQSKLRQAAEAETRKIGADFEKLQQKYSELQTAHDRVSRQLKAAQKALKALHAGKDILAAIEAA